MNSTWKEEKDWEQKAKENPLFAIMSEKVFENSTGNPTIEEVNILYAKGEKLWTSYLQPCIERFSIDISKCTIAEFGCGMGRLLRVPALGGANVYGIDISETQLNLAQKYFPKTANVNWVLYQNGKYTNIKEASVDFVYSFAVLQHIPNTNDLIVAIREMSRIMKAGGVLKIQLPVFGSPFGNFRYNGRYPFLCKNFGDTALVGYWKKSFGVRLPVIKLLRNNYWGRIGVSTSEIIHILNTFGIEVKIYEYNVTPNLTWITGVKIT